LILQNFLPQIGVDIKRIKRKGMETAETIEYLEAAQVVLGDDNYKAFLNADGHTIVLDEPVSNGGKNAGMNPVALLLGSLGGCSAITMKMYAQRKGIKLEDVKITLKLRRVEAGGVKKTIIEKEIQIQGEFTETQKTRLLTIADACPLHKMLIGDIEIKSVLKEI
jgi:putative redox protein